MLATVCSLLRQQCCVLKCSEPFGILLLVVATAGPAVSWLHNSQDHALAPLRTDKNQDWHFSLFALSFWAVNSLGKQLTIIHFCSLEQCSPWLSMNRQQAQCCPTLSSGSVKGVWSLYVVFLHSVQLSLLIFSFLFRDTVLCLFHSYAIRKKDKCFSSAVIKSLEDKMLLAQVNLKRWMLSTRWLLFPLYTPSFLWISVKWTKQHVFLPANPVNTGLLSWGMKE